MKISLVTTSVHLPGELERYAQNAKAQGHRDVDLIVVVDRSSANSLDHACEKMSNACVRCSFLDVKSQRALLAERASGLWKHLCFDSRQRRNIGFLQAWLDGAGAMIPGRRSKSQLPSQPAPSCRLLVSPSRPQPCVAPRSHPCLLPQSLRRALRRHLGGIYRHSNRTPSRHCIAHGNPSVTRTRNPGNLQLEFEQELVGYRQTGRLCQALASIPLAGASYLECLGEISAALPAAWPELPRSSGIEIEARNQLLNGIRLWHELFHSLQSTSTANLLQNVNDLSHSAPIPKGVGLKP